MRDPVGSFPAPIVVSPETARLIAAGEDKVEIPPVGHLVLIDDELRDVHGVRFELIVPAESFLGAAKAEGRNTSRDFKHPGNQRSVIEIL
jgi:hypothetical protein